MAVRLCTICTIHIHKYICTRAKRVPHHGLVALFDGAHSSNIDARTRRRSILKEEREGEKVVANCAAMASISTRYIVYTTALLLGLVYTSTAMAKYSLGSRAKGCAF